MNKFDEKHMGAVTQIVSWLVAADYKSIEEATQGRRLSGKLLRAAVTTYGKKLIAAPDLGLYEFDIVEIINAVSPSWSVNVNLWTVEEGRSDLSLECTVIERDAGGIGIEVDNLHAL
ncbi:DUF7668 domain-containing protein [Burkholderia sp. LMU1-1-1.1]|uniref:DUF7668 domain-containing protein n=1 Tax=Burkholderia sp. LMU1-1-1.1 TaxID=3135266 RepID=UPI00342C99D4